MIIFNVAFYCNIIYLVLSGSYKFNIFYSNIERLNKRSINLLLMYNEDNKQGRFILLTLNYLHKIQDRFKIILFVNGGS